MPTLTTTYRVFIASPTGLDNERLAFRETLYEVNDREGIYRDIYFCPIGWEDTLPGIGRPQELINQDLEKCDYMVLVLYDRWGSSTYPTSSKYKQVGIQEEYNLAMKCYLNKAFPMRQIVVYFKDIPKDRLKDPGDQLKSVNKFKRKIEREKQLLYSSYNSIDEFKRLIRSNLSRWIFDHEKGKTKEKVVNPNSIRTYELHDINHISLPNEIRTPTEYEIPILVKKAQKLEKQGNITDANICFAEATEDMNDIVAQNEYAKFLYRTGRNEQALNVYDHILFLAEERGDKGWMARASANQGIIYSSQGELNLSKQMLNNSLDYNKKINHIEGIADSYLLLAETSLISGEIDDALSKTNRAKKHFEKSNNESGISRCYHLLGVIERTRGDLNEARAYYQRSLKINEKLEDRKRLAQNIDHIATIHRLRGFFQKAIEGYTKSLKINLDLNFREGIADNYGHIGLTRCLRCDDNDLEIAEEEISESLSINENLARSRKQAKQHISLGILYWTKGMYDKSEYHISRALVINVGMKCSEGLAVSYYNLGTLYMILCDIKRALDLTEKSYYLNINIKNREGIAGSLHQLGRLQKAQGDYGQAENLHLQSLFEYKKWHSEVGIADVSYSLGNLYVYLSEMEKAQKYLEKSRNIYNKIKITKKLERLMNELNNIQ